MAKYWKLIVCLVTVIALISCEKKPEVELSPGQMTFTNNCDARATMKLSHTSGQYALTVEAGTSQTVSIKDVMTELGEKRIFNADIIVTVWDSVQTTHVELYNSYVTIEPYRDLFVTIDSKRNVITNNYQAN